MSAGAGVASNASGEIEGLLVARLLAEGPGEIRQRDREVPAVAVLLEDGLRRASVSLGRGRIPSEHLDVGAQARRDADVPHQAELLGDPPARQPDAPGRHRTCPPAPRTRRRTSSTPTRRVDSRRPSRAAPGTASAPRPPGWDRRACPTPARTTRGPPPGGSLPFARAPPRAPRPRWPRRSSRSCWRCSTGARRRTRVPDRRQPPSGPASLAPPPNAARRDRHVRDGRSNPRRSAASRRATRSPRSPDGPRTRDRHLEGGFCLLEATLFESCGTEGEQGPRPVFGVGAHQREGPFEQTGRRWVVATAGRPMPGRRRDVPRRGARAPAPGLLTTPSSMRYR